MLSLHHLSSTVKPDGSGCQWLSVVRKIRDKRACKAHPPYNMQPQIAALDRAKAPCQPRPVRARVSFRASARCRCGAGGRRLCPCRARRFANRRRGSLVSSKHIQTPPKDFAFMIQSLLGAGRFCWEYPFSGWRQGQLAGKKSPWNADFAASCFEKGPVRPPFAMGRGAGAAGAQPKTSLPFWASRVTAAPRPPVSRRSARESSTSRRMTRRRSRAPSLPPWASCTSASRAAGV